MGLVSIKLVWDLLQFPAPALTDGSATLIPHAHLFGVLAAVLWISLGKVCRLSLLHKATQMVRGSSPCTGASLTSLFSLVLIGMLAGSTIARADGAKVDGGHKVMHQAASSEIPWMDYRRLSFYLGLGYVRGSVTQSEVESSVNAAGITMDSFSINVNRLGYHLGMAYELNENFHVEGMYFNFGQVQVEASSSTVTEQQLADAFQDRLPGTGAGPLIGLKYNQWFINPYHRWFVRAGAFFSESGYDLTGDIKIKREENAAVFGAGYEYFYRDGLSVRAEVNTTRMNGEDLLYIGPTLVVYLDKVPRERMPQSEAKEEPNPDQPRAKSEPFKITIYFDFDKYVIPQREQHKIQKIDDYLARNPGAVAVLSGHTDSYGTKGYNVRLSNRRVKTVEHELVEIKKIDAQKIRGVYHGEEIAADGNWTPEGRQLNRRVNVCVIREGEDTDTLCRETLESHTVPFGDLKYVCKLAKSEARLEARHSETAYGGCEAFHKMPGRDWLRVGSATNQLEICTEIVERMRIKLEKSGFQCQDVSDLESQKGR